MLILTFFAILLTITLVVVWARWRLAARADYIRGYRLPPGLYAKLQAKRPELSLKDCQLIAHALRQFFLAYLKSNCRFVSMPSQVTDDLWHEFILYTRHYETFCKQAFGRFLHHTPAVVLGKNKQNNAGLRRVWWHTCKEENINPSQPTRLPLLFALDEKLNIANGFRYTPDCATLRNDGNVTGNSVPYCGGDFSNSSYDGGTDGFGDSSGDSSGDGGGDSGGGCGGGGD
jgi:hypothetical protein